MPDTVFGAETMTNYRKTSFLHEFSIQKKGFHK